MRFNQFLNEGIFSRKPKPAKKEVVNSQTQALIDNWIDGGYFKGETEQILATRLGKEAKEAMNKGVLKDWATNWVKLNPRHIPLMTKMAKKFTDDIMAGMR